MYVSDRDEAKCDGLKVLPSEKLGLDKRWFARASDGVERVKCNKSEYSITDGFCLI